MSKRHGVGPPGGREERRRRQFEDSRGLTGPRELPLDDESVADEPDSETEPDDADESSPPAESRPDEHE